jgi:hypothetical protein
MLLTIDVSKIDFLVVDVIELNDLGARPQLIMIYFKLYFFYTAKSKKTCCLKKIAKCFQQKANECIIFLRYI